MEINKSGILFKEDMLTGKEVVHSKRYIGELVGIFADEEAR